METMSAEKFLEMYGGKPKQQTTTMSADQFLQQFGGQQSTPAPQPELQEVGIGDMPGMIDKGIYATAVGLSNDPVEQAQIINHLSQGRYTSRYDEDNNPILKIGEQEYFLNKPGISGADARNFAMDATMFIPAGGLAARAGRGSAKKMLVGAAGAGATQGVKEVGSAQVGGDVDPEDITLATVAGGIGGAASHLAKRAAGGMKSRGDFAKISKQYADDTLELINLSNSRNVPNFP